MSPRFVVCVLLLATGCAHRAPDQQAQVVVDPNREIGRTHRPYDAHPAYMLAANRPLYAEARPPGEDNPCRRRSSACETRLRAELAALDGELLALGEPPTATQLQALQLTVQNLQPLLAPYPDLQSERQELAQHIAQLPTLSLVRQEAARRRMIELSDLLRVQLTASE
jgi:hypothetical protein